MADELQKIGWDTTRALCEAGNVQREPVFNTGLNEIVLLDTDDTTQYHFPSEQRLFTGSSGSLAANGVITSGAELVGVLDNSWSNITGDTDLQACLDSIDSAITAASAGTLSTLGDSGSGTVNLSTQDLTIAGTANEVDTVASAQTITISLPNDVTIANDLTVSNDFIMDIGGGDTITMVYSPDDLTWSSTTSWDLIIDCEEFTVKDGANNYLDLDSASATIEFGNTTDNPTTAFLGSGSTTFSGTITHTGTDVLFGKGLDVTGNVETSAGLIVGSGSITRISIPTNNATAFELNDGTDDYILIDTSTGSEVMYFGSTVKDPAYTFLGTGLVTIQGNLTVSNDLTVSGGTILLEIDDNVASAFKVREFTGVLNYIDIDTVTGSEKMEFGNPTDNPTYTFLGTGDVTVNGGVDVVSDCRARQVIADGDNAGIASTNSLTNVTAAADTNSPTHINTPTGVAAAQAVWIKMYVGTTATYVAGWQ